MAAMPPRPPPAAPPAPPAVGQPAVAVRPAWRRWLRRIRRIVTWLVVSLLLLVGLGLLVLQTDWARGQLLDAVLDGVNGAIAGKLRVERLEGDFLTHLALTGVHVDSPEGVEIARIEHVFVTFDLWALTRKEVEVGRVDIVAPRLVLFDAAGRLELARAFAPVTAAPPEPEPVAGEPSGWKIGVRAFTLTGGHVLQGPRLNDPALFGIDIRGALQVAAGVHWQDVTLGAQAANLPVHRLAVQTTGAFAAGTLSLRPLRIEAGPHALALQGEVRDLGGPAGPAGRVTLERLHADLAALSRALPGLPPLAGPLDLCGSVQGSPADFAATLQLDSAAGPLTLTAQGGLGGAGGPRLDLTVAATALAPGRLLPAFGLPLQSGLGLTAALRGDPRAAGRAELALDLYAPDIAEAGLDWLHAEFDVEAGRSRLRLAGFGPELGSLELTAAGHGLWPTGEGTATLIANDADLRTWAGLAALAGLQGTVERLRLDARTAWNPAGLGASRVALRLDAREFGAALRRDTPFAASGVRLRTTGRWPGHGLPNGTLRVDLETPHGPAAGAALLAARLAFAPAGERLRVTGTLTGSALDVPPAGVRIGTLSVPIEVALDPLQPDRPRGRVKLAAKGVRRGSEQLAELGLDAELRSGQRDLRLVGPLTVRDLRLAEGRRVGAARAVCDLTYRRSSGALRGTLKLNARDVAAAPGVHAEVLSTNLTLAPATTPAGPLGLQATFAVGGLRAGSNVQLAALQGRAAIELPRRRGPPTGSASLTFDRLTLAEQTFQGLAAEVRLEAGGQGTLGLRSTDPAVDLLFQGRFGLPSAADPALHVELRGLRLGHAGHGFTLAGRGAALRFVSGGEFALSGLTLRGIGALAPAEVDIQAALRPADDSLSLAARLHDLDLARLGEAIAAFTGKPLLPPGALGGLLAATATLSGPFARPVAELDLELRRGVVGPLGDIALRFQGKLTADAGLTLTSTATAAGGAQLTGAGTVPLQFALTAEGPQFASDAKAPLQAELSLTGLDLGLAAPYVPAAGGAPLAGRFGLRATLSGPLGDPRGQVDLALTELAYDTWHEATATARLDLHPDETHARLALTAGGRTLFDLQAELAAGLAALRTAGPNAPPLVVRLGERPLRAALHVPAAPLGDWPLVARALPEFGRVRLGIDLRAGGSLAAPVLQGGAHVSGLPFGRLGQGDVHVRLDGAAGRLLAEARAVLAGRERLALAAEVADLPALLATEGGGDPRTLLRNPGFRARLLMPPTNVFDLTALVPALGQPLAGLVGESTIDVHAAVQGRPAGPLVTLLARANAVASARPEPVEAGPLAHDVLLAAEVAAERTRLGVTLDQGPEKGALVVEAEVPLGSAVLLADSAPAAALPGTTPLRARLHARRFDLRGLERLAPAVFGATRGELEGDIGISGSLAEPTARGNLAARFTKLHIAANGLTQQDVTLQLGVQPERIVLAPLQLTAGGGQFTVKDVALSIAPGPLGAAQIGLQGVVDFERFPLVRRDELSATASGHLELAGTLARPRITGQLRVDEARIAPKMGGRTLQEVGVPGDVQFVGAAGFAAAEQETAQRERGSARLPDIDVAIEIPARNVRVVNDMLDMFLAGDIRTRSSGAALALEGRVGVVEGHVEMYGVPFTVSENSRVVFMGGREIDPRLDIQAYYDISGVDLSPLGLTTTPESRITVAVSGTASEPRLTLTSDPPMDETNIIAIMVTGSPAAATQSADAPSAKEQAQSLFVGLATGRLSRLLTRDLPLDVFKVEAGETGLRDADITIGKRITRDLTVFYKANLGAEEGENENEILVQYRLTRLLQVETYFGDAARGGLDLMLRWRF